jgi:transcriptional regulator
MYVPKHFEESQPELLHRLIRTGPFGTLVTMTATGLEANHLPLLVATEPSPFGTLRGHLARANAQWSSFDPAVEALVIFQGPQAYVSPSWYPTKLETGKVVPTWNYAVVHAYGQLRIVQDRDWLRRHVSELTNQHEAARKEPWQVSDAPVEFIETMLGAIVGVELQITRLVGKGKLSQNRSGADREGVIAGLEADEGEAGMCLAHLMKEKR